MDVEKSSLCNCVVNFLLEEKYLLTAFELLHELLEDGRHDQAIRLREFFADPNLFPADQIAKYNSLRVADPQSLLQEKETIEEKLAISEYELRLAREDLSRLKTELQKQKESSINGDDGPHQNINASEDSESQQDKRNSQLSSLGSLKDAERKDINCAIKEYLLFAGYRLTAMTFIEEVTDQNLDVWAKSPACVSDALRRYYYQYLSATNEAAEEKLSILRENESLAKENERLNQENKTLLKNKESVDNQIIVLTKSLESAQKDLKDREITIQGLRQSLDAQRKELNECRAEITSLKMHIEGTRASRQSPQVGNNLNEVKYIHNDAEIANGMDSTAQSSETKIGLSEDMLPMEKVVKMNEEKTDPDSIDPTSTLTSNATELPTVLHDENVNVEQKAGARDRLSNPHLEDVGLSHKSESPKRDTAIEKMALATIQTLSDALPKIVPYVLINHREELLPLIMCAIERHPDSSVRDSLTHTLFNLIKRPDKQQRRIIMDACVTLAKNVGEMRTETELLPQCWEQINHTYEERRLLVAQSCGELAEFVRPEIRDSLILSIVQQLIEDPATVVREAAAHNVALLLPLFPNRDKYFKVEELMFQLVCDPSGLVVETTLKELVPAVITWGGKLDHILRILMSHILSSVQRCPPLSGVEGSVESHFRVLDERERWNVDVLLRMLMELLPFIHQKCIETCPFTSAIESLTSPEQANSFFSTALLQLYAGGHMDWPAFDWMYVDCFPDLIQFSCLLPQKEDTLRTRIIKFLLDVHKRFGDDYLEHVMLPVFLVAVGDCDSADLKFFPPSIHSRVKGLRPKTAVAEKLAIMCVLPLLLSGVLGACASDEHLSRYLRKLLVQNAISEDSWSGYRVAEVIDAIRFVCTFEEHHGVVFNILWEMVVSSNTDMKTEAANLLKVLVPYIDVKVASTQVLPALVTLGSDQNLNVKYASIDAFGAVAQHFKNDMIVDKIHIQMDAFLEDGSHEATIAVIRALVGAVPHTTERLREYLLSKISSLTALPVQGTDIIRRREKADVFCEVVRALDATGYTVWESKADGAFAISEDTWNEPLGRGTEIRLHLREEAKEYLEESKLKELVKKYSEFINFPIYLWATKEIDVEVPADEDESTEEDETSEPTSTEEEEKEEDEEEEKKPKTKTIKETTYEWERLNDVKAIWLRSPKEVTEDEYVKFYHAIAKDFSEDKPLAWSHFNAEGDVEFKAMLFIPPKAPHDLYESYYNTKKSNLKLFVRRVFISDEFDELLPKYLSFLMGLVDSDTLPLNVSREMLQQHSSLKTIKKKLIRKALDMIRKIAEEDPDESGNKEETDTEVSENDEKKGKYAKFWNEFGKSIKLGIIEDAQNRNRLAKLLRFETSKSEGKLTSLDQYISRMKAGQKDFFYITGTSKEQLEKSPFLEKLIKKNYEVIFFTDPVDEYLMQYLMDYEDKKFQNVSKEGLNLGKDSKIKEIKEAFKELTKWWKDTLASENVDSVKISNRLSDTPCVVVTSKYGWSPNMERIMQAQTLSDASKQAYMRGKRVLEINPRHPIIKELRDRVATNPEDESIKETAQLIYQTALMESGFMLSDPKDFATRIYSSVKSSLNVSPDVSIEEEEEVEEPEVTGKEESSSNLNEEVEDDSDVRDEL